MEERSGRGRERRDRVVGGEERDGRRGREGEGGKEREGRAIISSNVTHFKGSSPE